MVEEMAYGMLPIYAVENSLPVINELLQPLMSSSIRYIGGSTSKYTLGRFYPSLYFAILLL